MDIAGFFSETGPLSTALAAYEYRPQQVAMAEMVARAFQKPGNALIEAGTGTGKSMAYLIPALKWAVENGEKVVVSTNTINLQEQLLKKDLPFLAQVLPFQFTAVLVKGWSNYICRYRLGKAQEESSEYAGQAKLVARLARAAEEGTGSRSELDFTVPAPIWEKVCCESDTCLRQKCPAFDSCFYFSERRQVDEADLLIVNHHLLFADLAVRQGVGFSSRAVLPPYRRVILDEAHHVEDVATQHFSVQLSYPALRRILTRIYRRAGRNRENGILATVRRTACALDALVSDEQKADLQNLIDGKLIPGISSLAEVGESFFRILRQFLSGAGVTGNGSLRLVPENHRVMWEVDVEPANESFAAALGELVEGLQELTGRFSLLADSGIDDYAGTLTGLEALTGRLRSYEMARQFLTAFDHKEYVFWGELSPSARIESRLSAAPIALGPHLADSFLKFMDTVVFTSATLSVARDFTFFRERVGINELPHQEQVDEAIFSSPFRYEEQAVMAIPTDLPDPNSPVYAVELAAAVGEWVLASRGRAFVLFTSYGLLRSVYRELACRLPEQYTLLCQGEAPRHRLLETFKSQDNAVLLGTNSFWEGVDVPGSGLSLVVITRLPFQVPDEPVVAARMDHLAAQGLNPFLHYQLPQAVIRLKQGFGRLIRNRQDNGVVVICDRRVVTKRYGRAFFNSLPRCSYWQADSSTIATRIADAI